MVPPQAILDTDILSQLMRKHPLVLARAHEYLTVHHQFTISIITRYEILRGLKAKDANTQQISFDLFCSSNRVIPITDEIVLQAADIYGDLHKRGALINDADILIAASALVNGFDLVTNNEEHFKRIAGLRVDNWLNG